MYPCFPDENSYRRFNPPPPALSFFCQTENIVEMYLPPTSILCILMLLSDLWFLILSVNLFF